MTQQHKFEDRLRILLKKVYINNGGKKGQKNTNYY
jgi:hypothetical protein